MSAFGIYGFFALANGRRSSKERAGSSSKPVWYCIYSTSLQCASGLALPVELRIFHPQSAPILADNIVAFVSARAYCPDKDGIILLEAYHLFPVPGVPSDEHYQDCIPNMQFPYAFGLGQVGGKAEWLPDRKSRTFPLTVGDYVRDSMISSNIQYVALMLVLFNTEILKMCL